MHQHPRSPLPSRQPNQRQPGPARDDVPRDQDDDRPPTGTALDTTRGLGIDSGVEAVAPAKEAITRLNQIIFVRCSPFKLRVYWLTIRPLNK
jgi:hypothetical protein